MGDAARRGTGGDQGLRDDEDCADAAVRRRAQRDLEVVGLREPADHGEAQAGRLAEVGEVDALLRLAQHPLGAPARLLAHADAAVLDLDGDARVHVDGGQVDLGLRRRVAGGVVEELGEGVDERFDRRSDHGDLGDRVELHALVVDDPGHGAAEHAVERDGLGPLAAGAGAAEDGDGVGEAPDERGAVVEAQEVAEDVGAAAVAVLHVAQFLRLLVDDGLDAACDVDEGALRGVAQVLLRDDGLQDGAQHGLVGGAELRGESGPVGAGLLQGGEHLLGELPLAQPLDDIRQELLRQADGLGLLPGEGRLLCGDGGAQDGDGPAAPGGHGAGEGDRREGDGADPGDGRAGGCGDRCDGDRRGNCGRQGGKRPDDG
nr:hypothetical protein [Streptomyces sp. WAC05292]